MRLLRLARDGSSRWSAPSQRCLGTSAVVRVADYHDHPAESSASSVTRRTRPRLEALREQLRRDSSGEGRSLGNDPAVTPQRSESPETPLIDLSPNHHPKPEPSRHTNPPVRIQHSPETYQEWQRLLATLPEPPSREQVLEDSFGRRHNYLRLSLTERCNFRCTYCMPLEGVPLQPNDQLLRTSELLTLAEQFAAVGVDKYRLTGGEPTLRRDIVEIVQGLKAINGEARVGITTNGFLLGQKPSLLQDLVDAGLDSMNVSLDSLDADKFARITRRPATYLPKVLQVLDMAQSLDVSVKVNIVVMRHQNDDELLDFVRLGHEKNVVVRFIEYMPFTKNGWNTDTFMSYREMMDRTSPDMDWTQLPATDPHDTTKWYHANESGHHPTAFRPTVGFITSMSHHFCAGCNRLRLSADGQIKVCLFDRGSHMVSLRNALRAGLSADELYRVIHAAVQSKPWALGGHGDAEGIQQDSERNRPMTLIGG